MKATLVYKTKDKYIDLFKSTLESIDYSCHHEEKSEDKLRDIFSIEIDEQEGEFKILIDPKDMILSEIKYHKDIEGFNQIKELNVRFDCSEKKEFINRIGNMMLDSDKVLDSLYERFEENLDCDKQMLYLLANLTENKENKLKVLGPFLEERFEEENSYLFARELDEFCKNIYEKEKEKQKTIGG